MGMSGFERELSRKATRRERRPAGNENLVISNKYHAVAGQSAAAAANEKAPPARGHSSVASGAIRNGRVRHRRRARLLAQQQLIGRAVSQRNPMDFKYL
jgi:hypothetical protein